MVVSPFVLIIELQFIFNTIKNAPQAVVKNFFSKNIFICIAIFFLLHDVSSFQKNIFGGFF